MRGFIAGFLVALCMGVSWHVVEDRTEIHIRCGLRDADDPCFADLDGDDLVGTSDFLLLSEGFGNVCD